jgi:hypothetical protein
MANAGCPLAAVGVRRMAPKDFKAKAKNAPEIGEPAIAAPLEMRTTDAPARKDRASAALQK